MKKIQKKFNLLKIAVIFTTAMLFVLTFFIAGNEKSAVPARHAISTTAKNNSAPAEHHNFQSNIFRTALPAVNSSKNENSSNPPLNRTYEALFNRTFTSFKTTFRTIYSPAENSTFQKYLKNSIPVRAGPHLC